MKTVIGENVLDKLNEYFKDNSMDRLYVITDDIVNGLYINYLKEILRILI